MRTVLEKIYESEVLSPDQFLYIGIDVHKDSHTAVATDCFGKKLFETKISNYKKDFKDLVSKSEKLATNVDKRIIFGLEDSYGNGERLAKYLYNKGFLVKMVHPVLVDRARKYETHPEKSDSLDALGVARVLVQRTDSLPEYSISRASQISREIKELVTDRAFLVKEQTRLKNQLHELLHRAYNTKYKEMFKGTFSKKALLYWLDHPVDEKLNSVQSTLEMRIKRKVKRLLSIRDEIKEINDDMEALIEKSGQKLETMSGCGVVVAACILAEIRDIKRFSSPHALAKYAGLCPRERSSGKTFKHVKTKSGNRRLNMAIHRIALSQIGRNGNDYAKTYFKRKVSEGKTKAKALCCLKRRLINIIYMMLKNKEEYNYLKKS